MQTLPFTAVVAAQATASATSITTAFGPLIAQNDVIVGFASTGEIITANGSTGTPSTQGSLTSVNRGVGGTTPAIMPIGTTIQFASALSQNPGLATLAAAISSTVATTITVTQTGPILPGEAPFQILVDTEQMEVTNVTVSGNPAGIETSGGQPGVTITLTVQRGLNGTTAATHSSGAPVVLTKIA